ncbi:MAG: twin-arginine translocation signal domain-containing protein [Anaerolineae bacterium]|nr:twin-arginine translocation signal domain-containing protein [Anaerolineae bacterium]
MEKVSRRQVLKLVGITAASLVIGRTVWAGIESATPRGKLRWCWLRAAEIERKSQGKWISSQDLPEIEALYEDHSDALSALVKHEVISQQVADQIDAAFRTGLCRKMRDSPLCQVDENGQYPLVMCYFILKPPIWKQGLDALFKQSEILIKAGWVWPLDDELLAWARANVERDLMALTQSSDIEQAAQFLLSVLLEK